MFWMTWFGICEDLRHFWHGNDYKWLRFELFDTFRDLEIEFHVYQFVLNEICEWPLI